MLISVSAQEICIKLQLPSYSTLPPFSQTSPTHISGAAGVPWQRSPLKQTVFIRSRACPGSSTCKRRQEETGPPP